MGRNQYCAWRVYDLCVYYKTGTPEGSTESGSMEKLGIEPATPGLQGIALIIALIHYTLGALQVEFTDCFKLLFVAVFRGCTSTGRVGLCFLWFYVQELPKAQPAVKVRLWTCRGLHFILDLRLYFAWLLQLMVSRNVDTIIPVISSDNII